MKNLFKSSMLVAIVAAALVGCSKDTTETNAPVVNGTTVHFKAEVADDTDGSRASLTPDQDETLFTAAWENTDEIGISAESVRGEGFQNDYNLCGTRKNDVFSTTFINCPDSADLWDYYAYYPYTANASTDYNITIPFGGERIQYGNDYNSAYDIMAADKIAIGQHAAAGKDAKDNPLIFAMHRLTAIAYFHFTTTAAAKSEKVLSVTLSATPSVAEEPLAADEVSLFYGNTSEKKHSCVAKTGAANSIKITYDPATAPTAADFKAWFNVLPGIFSDVKIAIETENYTATITRTGDVLYEAGKLYKVSTSIKEIKWQEKAAEKSGYVLVTDASTLAAGDKIIIVENAKAKAAGTLVSNYLSAVDVTITNNTIATLPANVAVFTLGGKAGEWTLTSAEGTLGATAVKALAYNTGTKTWSISINPESEATIQNTTYGRFLYNVQYTRFTTYTSNTSTDMLLPKIYRAVGPALTIVFDIQNVVARGVENAKATNVYEIKNFKNGVDDVTVESVGGCVKKATKTADGTITYTVAPNYTSEAASGTIVLKSAANSVSATINVSQLADTFKAARTTVELDATAGAQTTVTITSDYDWTIDASNLTGASVTPMEFVYNPDVTDPTKKPITIRVTDANTGETSRDLGSFDIIRVDGKTINVTVTQKEGVETLAAPKDITKQSFDASQLVVTWPAVAKATSYNYRLTDSGAPVDVTGTTTTEGNTVTLTLSGTFAPATEYVLYVKSVGDGVNYKDSDEESINVSFSAGGGTTETIKISSLKLTDKQDVTTKPITQGDVTITFTKGSNSNPPKYYTNGTAIRAYGGNTFAVSVADKTITNITITFGSGEGTNTITTDVGTFKTPTWTGSAKTVTFTIEGTSGHRRLAEIAVTYK